MSNYNCPKGAMKWTHRFMILSIIVCFIGIGVIVYSIISDNSKLLYSGLALCGLYVLIMLVAAANAYNKKCYKTANLIMFGYPFA